MIRFVRPTENRVLIAVLSGACVGTIFLHLPGFVLGAVLGLGVSCVRTDG